MRAYSLLLVAFLMACSSDDDIPNNTAVDSGQTGADASNDGTSTTLSDAEIVGVALALNTGEVDQGKLAQMNATRSGVKDFADMMVMEHTAALMRDGALGITAADSSLKTQVTTDAMTTLEMLKTKSGAAFDTAYIDAQVTMHTKALDIVEKQLLPSAMSAALKTELDVMRAAITTHQMHAKTLQGSTSDAGTESGTSDGGATDGSSD